jgi:RNA polymerase sigma-70 factor, ECF subfamily
MNCHLGTTVAAEGDRKLDDSFVELMTRNQLRLRSFILTLVRDAPAADDVFQESSLVMWRKRQDFDFSKDFFRWACGVALLEVLQYRRKADTDRLLFDEDLVQALAVDYVEHVEVWDLQRSALRGCIQKLSSNDKWLLDARYLSGLKTAQIAQQLSRPLSTVYSSLSRIREALFRCVHTTIAQEAHP